MLKTMFYIKNVPVWERILRVSLGLALVFTASFALAQGAADKRRSGYRDMGEALCLLLPGIMRELELRPMTDPEAADFRRVWRARLNKEAVGK